MYSLENLPLNTINNEDCVEFMKKLPNDSVDMIVADPPYNIGKDKGDNWDTIENYIELFEQWIIQWKRVLKEDGLLYCYCSQLFQADIEMIFRKHMHIQNRIIWCYNNGQRQATKRLPFGYEPLFMISKSENFKFKPIRDPNNIQQGIRTKKNQSGSITITQPNPDGVKFTDVWNIPKLSGGAKKTKHPTEKPLELGNRMLRSLDNLKLIYIPFGGSGTEVINCIENKIDYIVTELSKEYIYNIILPRIETLKSP